MNERRLLQEALAGLSQPETPPRLRHRVLASVRREVGEPPSQTWVRTQVNGWTIERREGVWLPEARRSGHSSKSPAVKTTQSQHMENANLVTYWTTE